jgi:DNA end-binding protein Ku
MAPRANWTGYLKLSLVSCAVDLFPATTTRERVHFHIMNRETGNRVRYDVVDAETGDEVLQADRVKGYKLAGDRYVLLDEEELDEVALESTHTIDIEAFVPRRDVDDIYLDAWYYLVPSDKAGYEAYAVIRDAMREKSLVGLARAVLFRRERLLMLSPLEKGIAATVLHYDNEVKDAADYFDDIANLKVPKDMLQLAGHILDTKTTKLVPSKFEDRYESALKALIRAKQHGTPPPSAPSPQPSNVVSLMDALRRSVKGGARAPAGRARGLHKRAPPKSAPKSAPNNAPKRVPRRRKLKRAG